MLSLNLRPGEYITIGENVVVQYDHTLGDTCKIMVSAPREIPIVRGTLLERSGEQRPDCVCELQHRYRRTIPWNRGKTNVLAMVMETLTAMEAQDGRATNVKRRLKAIFPYTDIDEKAPQAKAE